MEKSLFQCGHSVCDMELSVLSGICGSHAAADGTTCGGQRTDSISDRRNHSRGSPLCVYTCFLVSVSVDSSDSPVTDDLCCGKEPGGGSDLSGSSAGGDSFSPGYGAPQHGCVVLLFTGGLRGGS